MFKVSREFLQTIVNYKHASSNDETRPFLQTVAIRRLDESLELIACDGYIIVKSLHSIVDLDILGNAYCLIPAFNIDKIKLFLKENKGINIFSMSIDDGIICLGIDNDSMDLKINLLDREYPNTDRLFSAKSGSKKDSITMDADLIYTLRKAVYGSRKIQGAARFNFEFTRAYGPLKATCKHEGIEHELLIMPLKV